MLKFTGLKASPGVVVGPVERIDHGTAGLHRIVSDPFRERALYEAAIVLAKDELRRLQQFASGADADILMFQIALLEDDSFTTEIGDYIAAGAGSAAAVERAEQIFAGRLKDVDNDYIRERSVDVCDACRRVVNILDGRPRRRIHLTKPSILASDVFYPSDLFSLDRRMILGLVAEEDSDTSHASIMARSMGIPAMVRLGSGMATRAEGQRAILDAEEAVLVLSPTPEQLAKANGRAALWAARAQTRDPLADLPCLTKDGTPFALLASASVSTPEEILAGPRVGAVGIGLLSTASLQVNGYNEQRQYCAYLGCLSMADGAPLVFRINDPDQSTVQDAAPPLDSATRWQMFRTQMCALLRAGAGASMQMVVPLVSSVEEWDETMRAIDRCRADLNVRGEPYRTDQPFGCIIEIPSAALLAEELIEHGAAFLAIDIDDLARYTCAAQRGAGTREYRVDNPAVLRLVQSVLEVAQRTKTPVYLCGLTRAAIPAVPAYLKIGARAFCTEVAYLNDLKAQLLETDLEEQES